PAAGGGRRRGRRADPRVPRRLRRRRRAGRAAAGGAAGRRAAVARAARALRARPRRPQRPRRRRFGVGQVPVSGRTGPRPRRPAGAAARRRMTRRLLMTARDAGASFHLIEVARAALAAGDIALEVATQMPASRYFADAGIPHRALPLPAARAPDDASAAALLACADGLVETVRPDAVLCGLSTPGDGGIDEAVIARFAGPSLVLQDFWGEVN